DRHMLTEVRHENHSFHRAAQPRPNGLFAERSNDSTVAGPSNSIRTAVVIRQCSLFPLTDSMGAGCGVATVCALDYCLVALVLYYGVVRKYTPSPLEEVPLESGADYSMSCDVMRNHSRTWMIDRHTPPASRPRRRRAQRTTRSTDHERGKRPDLK